MALKKTKRLLDTLPDWAKEYVSNLKNTLEIIRQEKSEFVKEIEKRDRSIRDLDKELRKAKAKIAELATAGENV